MSDALELVLVNETVTGSAERVDDAVIFTGEDDFRGFQLEQLVAEVPLDLGLLVHAPFRRHDSAFFESAHVLNLLDDLVDHVHDPSADRLNDYLRAFAMQELEHIEVTIAFGGLRPELAGDLDDRLYAEAIHLDRVVTIADVVQGFHVVVADELVDELAEVLDSSLHRNLVRHLAELRFH